MVRLLIVLFIVLQYTPVWAVEPLAVEEETELEEGPPLPQIQEIIEKEKQEREEVIQRRDEELKQLKELVKKPKIIRPIPVPKSISKTVHSLIVVVITLVIFVISFLIYRKR